MAIYAIKRANESNDAVQQRFKKQVQRSELLKGLRARARFLKKPTKRLLRLRALKRELHRAQNRKQQFYSNM